MSNDWIDDEGFRANVGIILSNVDGRVLLAGRVGSKGWQFPQGGMRKLPALAAGPAGEHQAPGVVAQNDSDVGAVALVVNLISSH